VAQTPGGYRALLKTDRIGLVIVVASLLAIAAIVVLLFDNQRDNRLSDIRSQGIGLARALSGLPYDQLVPKGERSGLVEVIRQSAADNNFAYIGIVDTAGRKVAESVSDGLIIPHLTLPNEPSGWLGSLELDSTAGGEKLIEFHAPLLRDGELQGFVRLGYYNPAFGLSVKQIPFVAMVALPVFLLAPLFHFLLRLEVRPIKLANEQIGKIIESEDFGRMEVTASGDLGDFMHRFNRFIEFANTRVRQLEADNQQLHTSSKLLGYRKNRVETVLETLPEAVMILDETGAITFANQKLAAIFGVAQEAILTQQPQRWCDHPDILNLLAKFQQGGGARNFTETIRFNFGAAQDRAFATKTYPLFAPKNPSAAIGTLIVLRDESQESMARKARGEFVSHLSHELKSPLNVLALYSETLLSEAGSTKEFRIEAANVIAAEVDRLSSLINGLLSMTKIESGSLVPDKSLVKLREVATTAFQEARNLAIDKNLVFDLKMPKEINPVLVDKDLIRIAITNLLSNAVKYNQDGGVVRLSVEETEDAIRIRIEDTGIGVCEEDEHRIFQKFFRSEDERVQNIGGHGLGLPLAKQIVELHHGTLTLNRERAAGAEFIINLWKDTTAVRQAI